MVVKGGVVAKVSVPSNGTSQELVSQDRHSRSIRRGQWVSRRSSFVVFARRCLSLGLRLFLLSSTILRET